MDIFTLIKHDLQLRFSIIDLADSFEVVIVEKPFIGIAKEIKFSGHKTEFSSYDSAISQAMRLKNMLIKEGWNEL